LSEDVQARLKINSDRIYTGGFSGGAKVAAFVALSFPGVKGVIANGAGLPDGTPAGDFNFSFTAIAGRGDMNLTDLLALSSDLDKSRTWHRLILFDGKHEWAPENTMDLAFAGLQFDAMRKTVIPKEDAFIRLYAEKSKRRLDSYCKNRMLIKAVQECAFSISLLDGVSGGASWFRKKADSLAASGLYRQQRQEQEALLVRERNTKEEYMRHFQQIDRPYWDSVIDDGKTRAHAKTGEGEMHQRLLAYLSLAFYSISNQLIKNNDNGNARYFVELYKKADPANTEAWYFSAILHSREGQPRAAENDLLKAAGYGFSDRNRMIHQPEFQHRSEPIDFSKIERQMPASH
jgi:hypothetical protein